MTDRFPLSTPTRQYFVQIAYHVADLDTAVERWHRATGIGPFMMRRHIALNEVTYRGRPAMLEISAAHAQAGPWQLELVQQHGDDPSAFRDMFAAEAEGLHHLALFPEDHDALVRHYAEEGCAIATGLRTAEGRGASYVDARKLVGHMIEIYQVNDSLFELYNQVADRAARWDRGALTYEI